MIYKYLKNPGETQWIGGPYITPENKIGFVYKIYNKKSKKTYIGIKTFWAKSKYPPLKGKKNKRHYLKETNWRKYNSSGTIADDVKKNPNNYVKTIMELCDSKQDMKAREAFYQLEYYMKGRWDELENEMINLRLRIR